jgi:hypothetical protein
LAAFCGFAAGHPVQKSVSLETLKPHDAMNCSRSFEIRTPAQSLAVHSKAMHGIGTPGLARNLLPRDPLNPGLRFSQSSNINSTDESCGKLKATRFVIFSCGKTRFFRGGCMALPLPAKSCERRHSCRPPLPPRTFQMTAPPAL